MVRDAQQGSRGYMQVGTVPDPWNCKVSPLSLIYILVYKGSKVFHM